MLQVVSISGDELFSGSGDDPLSFSSVESVFRSAPDTSGISSIHADGTSSALLCLGSIKVGPFLFEDGEFGGIPCSM